MPWRASNAKQPGDAILERVSVCKNCGFRILAVKDARPDPTDQLRWVHPFDNLGGGFLNNQCAKPEPEQGDRKAQPAALVESQHQPGKPLRERSA